MGSLGEYLAARYLSQNQYALWRKNWRCRRGELDLIALKNRRLRVIEVKTRFLNSKSYTPLDQMTDSKLKQLQQLAAQLLSDHAVDFRRRRVRSVHIDFIGIELWIDGLIPRYTIALMPDIVPLSGNVTEYLYDSANSTDGYTAAR